MKITIEFETDTDAFYGAMFPGEVSRVLLQAEEKIEGIYFSNEDSAEKTLRDSNGNTVGFVRVTES